MRCILISMQVYGTWPIHLCSRVSIPASVKFSSLAFPESRAICKLHFCAKKLFKICFDQFCFILVFINRHFDFLELHFFESPDYFCYKQLFIKYLLYKTCWLLLLPVRTANEVSQSWLLDKCMIFMVCGKKKYDSITVDALWFKW